MSVCSLSVQSALLTGVLLSLGCASSKKDSPASFPADEAGFANSTPPPVEVVSVPITELSRNEVVEVVDGGLGRFLGNFETEASLNERGEFLGFRILRIHEPARFRGLGIGPGDVVTSINDQPIERPAQAYAAFVALKSAPSLEIDYLRGGRPMRLSLPIVGSSGGAASSKTDAPSDAKASSNDASEQDGPDESE